MIKLISKYPYDNSYDIIKTFETKSQQENYFDNFNYESVHEHNYVRVNHNTLRVPFSYENLTNNSINYLIFKNSGKTYYAFIVDKVWISEEVTEIIFEIDVIQTFMFNIKTKSSFIERMNCSIDEIADFDEGLEFGEHSITQTMATLDKTYNYFAMFGGIRQECVTIDNNGNVTNVSQINTSVPYETSKVNGIDYPLYFIPLKESYLEPSLVEVLH